MCKKTLFGENLKKYRKENNISRSRIARKTGISHRTLENIEYGISEPRYSDAKDIALYLGASLSELCGYDVSEVEKFKSIPDFIRYYMRKCDFTNRERLSVKIGLSKPAISNFIREKSEPKLNNIVTLLEVFGIGADKPI